MDAKRLEGYRRRLWHRWPLIGGWLQRRAARALAADGSPTGLRVLADAVADSPDPAGRRLALATLERLDSQASVDAVAAAWARARNAALESLLRARGLLPSGPTDVRLLVGLKLGRVAALHELDRTAAPALVAALDDSDADVVHHAEQLAGEWTAPEARAALADQLCAHWAETRSPRLEALVCRGRLVAAEPLPVRVLSALKTGQQNLLRDLDAAVAEPLAAACADRDPVIAAAARQTLRELRHPEAREAVCRLFLERDDAHAREAALAAGYLPQDEHRRALFFFLTEQWERYEALDFDRRLLLAVREAADAPLRQRILDRLRAAGRADFLTALAGSDYRSRAGRVSAAEADVLVQLLAEHREWDKLWALVFELPLVTSARVVALLARQDWRPRREDERATFERLAALAADGWAADGDASGPLPPAVQRARARVPGRVNDVVFSPCRPLIAVGTGRRKVVLWNYQKGETERVLGGFDHSIGRVTFTGDDTLLCSERGQAPETRRTLHGWRNGEPFTFTHKSAVTALEPCGPAQALIAFRDQRVALFDAIGVRPLGEQRFRFWCRAVQVAPGGGQAALLHEGVSLVTLPGLEPLAASDRRELPGVITCAAFAGEGALLAGKYNGLVWPYRQEGERLRPGPEALVRHKAALQGIELLCRGSVLLTASADGTLLFTSRADQAPLGRVEVPARRLTSLHFSPGGEFMAVGDSDAALSLWDLRVLEVRSLLSRPFAAAVPAHLGAVTALVGGASPLPPGLANALHFIQCALQHRFRYEIEVDEVPAIQAGEFDIEVA